MGCPNWYRAVWTQAKTDGASNGITASWLRAKTTVEIAARRNSLVQVRLLPP